MEVEDQGCTAREIWFCRGDVMQHQVKVLQYPDAKIEKEIEENKAAVGHNKLEKTFDA